MADGPRYNLVDPSLEITDPNPNIHQLFVQFNDMFFWGKLATVYVKWSPRMTLCAGLCRYHPRNRECSIHLSQALLGFRPRKDLVETLLHEMIHAYLFMADGDRERESHGPKFHEHMYRINRLTGTNITVYHTFHDEVDHFKTHWWKCDGPCQHRPPFYGILKRSMNRAPGPSDYWYKDHERSCGGKFHKIKEPEPKKAVKRKKEDGPSTSKGTGKENNKSKKIKDYFTPISTPTSSTSTTAANPATIASTTSALDTSDIEILEVKEVKTFTGTGQKLGSGSHTGSSIPQAGSSRNISLVNDSQSRPGQAGPPRRGDHPLLAKWLANYKNKP